MKDVADFLRTNWLTLVTVGAVVTFLWNATATLLIRKAEARAQEFETYHRLMGEMVRGQSDKAFADQQAAVAFEFRQFKRYRPFTLRTLRRLQEQWTKENADARLLDEVSRTVKFLEAEMPVGGSGDEEQ